MNSLNDSRAPYVLSSRTRVRRVGFSPCSARWTVFRETPDFAAASDWEIFRDFLMARSLWPISAMISPSVAVGGIILLILSIIQMFGVIYYPDEIERAQIYRSFLIVSNITLKSTAMAADGVLYYTTV